MFTFKISVGAVFALGMLSGIVISAVALVVGLIVATKKINKQ